MRTIQFLETDTKINIMKEERKIRTAELSVVDAGKNVIISETLEVDGSIETISVQLVIDYSSQTVSVRPIGTWVDQNNYMLTLDNVNRIEKQAIILAEVAVQVKDALSKI